MRELSINEIDKISGGLDPLFTPFVAALALGIGAEMVRTGAILAIPAGFIAGPYLFAAPVNYSAPVAQVFSNITANIVNSPIHAVYGAVGGAVVSLLAIGH